VKRFADIYILFHINVNFYSKNIPKIDIEKDKVMASLIINNLQRQIQ